MKEKPMLKKSLKSCVIADRQKFPLMINKVIQTIRKVRANLFMDPIEGAKGNGKKSDKILTNEPVDKTNNKEL